MLQKLNFVRKSVIIFYNRTHKKNVVNIFVFRYLAVIDKYLM